ncbi:MAG: zf-HC2 domain-containing protein [bacterium]
MERCDEIKIKLTLYADNSLADAERAAVDEHLSACPNCRAALDETRSLLDILSSGRLQEPSAEFMEQLSGNVYKEVAARDKAVTIHSLRFRKLTAAASLAAAIFILVFTAILLQNKHSEFPTQQALNRFDAPEDMVMETFTYTPPAAKQALKSAAQGESGVHETATSQDIEWVAGQVSASMPAGNDELLNMIEAMSDSEAKDMLEYLDNPDPQSKRAIPEEAS